MVKWEMNRCYECLLSYLFLFLFVHCTHWRFACCEIVARYCAEVLRICECLVIEKVEFCVKNAKLGVPTWNSCMFVFISDLYAH